MTKIPQSKRPPAPVAIATLIPDVAAALIPATSTISAEQARIRRDVTRELDRQVHRALWRAERRGRGLKAEVRQGARWVNAQRRKIAHELTRALRSLGAGPELAIVVAERACQRFPRDGVVVDDLPNRPRARGESPRQVGKNPRARGDAPRQLGRSPRQRRAAADLSDQGISNLDRSIDLAPASTPAASTPSSRPVQELVPTWDALKAEISNSLEPHERRRALQRMRKQLGPPTKLDRGVIHPPPTTE